MTFVNPVQRTLTYLLFVIAGLLFMVPGTNAQELETNNAGLVAKVAPGELLPISVKLSNFGGNGRVDVLITYSLVTREGNVLSESNETAAVETTANFIKTVQVPAEIEPGAYIARTSITYVGQLVPATSQFPFTVERKILGLFQSQFLLYAIVTLVAMAFVLLLAYLFIRHRRTVRFTPFEYTTVPRDQRMFYEILSDTIQGMRRRVGDDALLIAARIPGLKIDPETGRVLALKAPPAQLIAALVSEYEKRLGKKVSFSFRKEKTP